MSEGPPVAVKLNGRTACKALLKDRMDYRGFCPYGVFLLIDKLIGPGFYQRIRITTELLGPPVKAKEIK
jgi:hypothetical protein